MHPIAAPLNAAFVVAPLNGETPRLHGDVRVFAGPSAAAVSDSLGGGENNPTWKADLSSVFLLDAAKFVEAFGQELLGWGQSKGVMTQRHLYTVSRLTNRLVNGKEESFELAQDYPTPQAALDAAGVDAPDAVDNLVAHGVKVSSVYETPTGQRLSIEKLEKKIVQQWAAENSLDGVWWSSPSSSRLPSGILFSTSLAKVAWERVDILPVAPTLNDLLAARQRQVNVVEGFAGAFRVGEEVEPDTRVFPKPR